MALTQISSEGIKDAQVKTADILDANITTAKIADNTVTGAKLAADAITAAKIADDVVNSEHIAAGAVDLEHMSANSIDSDQYVDGSIDTAHIADLQVTTAKIAADAITAAKIADDAINSEHYIDGSIDTAHLADNAVTSAKIANVTITGGKIADDAINSQHYADGSIDTAHIADAQITTAKIADTAVTTAKITDGNVTTAKIAADAITAAKIADDVVNSEHYAAASIDTEHIADSQITTAKIAADAVTNAKIADDQIDSEHYVDGSIDTAHIANLQVTTAKIAADAITGAKIADDAIDSEHYTDGSIDTAHIADLQITTGKIANDAINGTKIADDSIDSEHYIDGSIDNAHVSGSAAIAVSKLADFTANDANNRILTATGTKNSYNGEANLTYDGNNLALAVDANGEGVNLTATGNYYPEIEFNANRSAANNTLGYLNAKWNNTEVASISFNAGADTTNKDDAYITFNTAAAGSNAEAMRINADGDLCVGKTSAIGKAEIATSASEIGLTVSNSVHDSQLQILATAANKNSSIFFGDNDDGNIGHIDYDHNDNNLNFRVNAAERMRIDSSGRVGIGLTPHTSDVTTNVTEGLIQTDGNIDIRYAGVNTDPAGARYINFINTDTTLVPDQPMGGLHFIGNDSSNSDTITASITAYCSGSSGSQSHILFKTGGTEKLRIQAAGGISFNGDTAADNALDDYEEGAHTPTDASGQSLSLTIANSKYTRIGRLCFYQFDVTYPSTSDTSNARISSPFSINAYGGGWVGWNNVGEQLLLHGSSTSIYFMQNDSASGSGTAKHAKNNELSGKRMIGGFVFNVA
jgi:hypothetical protein